MKKCGVDSSQREDLTIKRSGQYSFERKVQLLEVHRRAELDATGDKLKILPQTAMNYTYICEQCLQIFVVWIFL